MAGSYPDVPSWRMAIDRDGTQLILINNGVLTSLAASVGTTINNEADDDIIVATNRNPVYFVAIFPELRDVDGFHLNMNVTNTNTRGYMIQTSSDTTNGLDGTWTTLATGSMGNSGQPAKPGFRIVSASTVLSVRAIRIALTDGYNYGTVLKLFHLFGEIAPAENPNRLALWHPTLDQRITPAYFDWGNVPRSSSADRTFRVKNLSTVQTANSVRVAQEILTDTVPSVVGQHTLSTDGLTFLAQVNVGTLAPGAISAVTTLRRVTPSDAVLSLWAHRVFAEATTWS